MISEAATWYRSWPIAELSSLPNYVVPFLVVLHVSLSCLVEVLFSMLLRAFLLIAYSSVPFGHSSLVVSTVVLQLRLHRFSILSHFILITELFN